MSLIELVKKIENVKYVKSARLWEKGNHSRVYIKTAKFNGGYNWNNGLGYNGMYLNTKTGELHLGREAGAETRRSLEDTVEAIREIGEKWVR